MEACINGNTICCLLDKLSSEIFLGKFPFFEYLSTIFVCLQFG